MAAIADFAKCVAIDLTAVYGAVRGTHVLFSHQFDDASADYQVAVRINLIDVK